MADERADADEDEEVSTRLTPPQGLLLLRFVTAKLVLDSIGSLFRAKYLLLVGAVLVIVVDVSMPVVGLLIVLFVLAAAVQWIVSRLVGRLGAFERLPELDRLWEGGTSSLWPNLRGELKRVGLKSRPWSVLLLASRFATRRLPGHQDQALRQIDWSTVIGLQDLLRARVSLARAAADPAEGAADAADV